MLHAGHGAAVDTQRLQGTGALVPWWAVINRSARLSLACTISWTGQGWVIARSRCRADPAPGRPAAADERAVQALTMRRRSRSSGRSVSLGRV